MRPPLWFLAAALPTVLAQLSGRVGPTTSTASKRAKVCDVTKYGATASKTADIGPAIVSAFAACKSGGTGELHFDCMAQGSCVQGLMLN